MVLFSFGYFPADLLQKLGLKKKIIWFYLVWIFFSALFAAKIKPPTKKKKNYFLFSWDIWLLRSQNLLNQRIWWFLFDILEKKDKIFAKIKPPPKKKEFFFISVWIFLLLYFFICSKN